MTDKVQPLTARMANLSARFQKEDVEADAMNLAQDAINQLRLHRERDEKCKTALSRALGICRVHDYPKTTMDIEAAVALFAQDKEPSCTGLD